MEKWWTFHKDIVIQMKNLLWPVAKDYSYGK